MASQLLSDTQGIALEQYLFRVASEEINFVVSDAIINGSGSGQPLGMLNRDHLVELTVDEQDRPAIADDGLECADVAHPVATRAKKLAGGQPAQRRSDNRRDVQAGQPERFGDQAAGIRQG